MLLSLANFQRVTVDGDDNGEMYSKFNHFTSLTGRYQQRNISKWKRRANIVGRAELLVWVIRPVYLFVCCPQARSRQFFCLFVFFFFFFSLKPILLFQAKSVSKLYQLNYFSETKDNMPKSVRTYRVYIFSFYKVITSDSFIELRISSLYINYWLAHLLVAIRSFRESLN